MATEENDDKIEFSGYEVIHRDPAEGWVGGFVDTNPDFPYPKCDLSSLKILGNLDNIDKLHTMAEALMKYETIDADQIDDIMEGKTPRPPSGWDDDDEGGTPVKKKRKTRAKKAKTKSSKDDDAPSSEPPAKPA